MFPKIENTKTRVVIKKGAKPVVEFYNDKQDLWGEEITLTFNRQGMAIFTLNANEIKEPYIFFGALQKTENGLVHLDTNWDFMINGAGNTLTFNNDCKHKENIDIRLSLIPQGDVKPLDRLVSADPKIKNRPN
jgi:hypothetical protein